MIPRSNPPFPDTLLMAAGIVRRDPSAGSDAPSAPGPRSERTLRALAALGRDGIDADALAERFPQRMDELGERWETPGRVLELVGAMMIAEGGGRPGLPGDSLALLLALQRHTVRRIVAAAGLRPPPAGDQPGNV